MAIGTGMLIAGGVQALSGIGQSLIGWKQRRDAMADLRTLKDPTMEMPSSITQMIELAKDRTSDEMPGMATARAEMGARTGRGIEAVTRAARTPGDIAAATKDLYAEEMRGVRQLATAGAEYRADRERERRRELMGAYGTQAQYEQKMFEVNEMMPYQRRLQQYMSQAQIGGQNVAAGIGTAASAATDTMSNYLRLQMMEQWMDQEGTPQPTMEQKKQQGIDSKLRGITQDAHRPRELNW